MEFSPKWIKVRKFLLFLSKILYAGRPRLERHYLSCNTVLPRSSLGEASSSSLQKDEPCLAHFSLSYKHTNLKALTLSVGWFYGIAGARMHLTTPTVPYK